MPDPIRRFLPTVLPDDRLAMMQPPAPGPGGIAGFLGAPGVREGMLAAGLRLLASDKRRETFGQALYDAVPQGLAAYEDAKQGADWNTLLNDSAMPDTQKAVLRMIGPERGALVLAQGMMQPEPEQQYLEGREGEFFRPNPDGSLSQLTTVPEDVTPPPTTDNIVEYERAKAEGFMGTLAEWKTQTRSPGVVVNTGNNTQQNVQQEYWGKRYGETQEAARSAFQSLGTLNEMATLASMPETYQGTGADAVLRLKQLGTAMGLDVGGVGEAEALRSISNRLALEARNPANGTGMPGSMSDGDRVFLTQTVARLQNTPEGNALIIQMAARLAQRNIEVAQLADEYASKNHGNLDGGFTELLRQRYANSDMFADLQARADTMLGSTVGARPNPLGLPVRGQP